MRFRYKRIFCFFLIPLAFLLMQLAQANPSWVETVYSSRFYSVLSQGVSNVTGLLPFSMAETLLWLLAFAALAAICYGVYVFFKNIRRYKDYILGLLANLLAACSIVYFVFVVLCGFNYNRYPFSHFAELGIQPREAVELAQTTRYLLNEAVTLRQAVPLDENGCATMPYTFEEASELARSGLDNLSRDYPILRGMYSPAKPVRASSGIMTRLNLCGFFFPFTFEANVNADLVPSELAFTLCHEMAHVRGFMREDDANFISYLACQATDDPSFQYSGTLHSLIHCLNALYRADSQLYSQVMAEMDAGIASDIRQINAYWAPYSGKPASKFSQKVNDSYLKVNNQSAGVDSYGNTVDSLIAYYKSLDLEEPTD